MFSVSSSANGQGSVSFKINSEGVVWDVSSNQELNIPIVANPLEEMVANFTASTQTASSGTSIQFYDASSGDPTNYSWSFPGGSPSTSTFHNPVVTYANLGSYDVTLSVSGNGQSDTETKTDYISIEINEFDITGSVVEYYGNHSAIQGVSVEFIPNSNSEGNESGIITTDYNGEFIFSVSEGWQGSVMFSKAGYANTSQVIGFVDSNHHIGEIGLQQVVLDFSIVSDGTQCVEFEIQTNVPFHHAYFYWTETVSGDYSQVTFTKNGQLCFNDCTAGENYSIDMDLCLYDINNQLIGSCISKNISFLFEPIDTECDYVDITASYQIEQGGNVFSLGTALKFKNTSFPQSCIMTSAWWFDEENKWADCSWWDINFDCDASCKFDLYQNHNCSGVVDPSPFLFEKVYNSKGDKVIRLAVSSACNAGELALDCDKQYDYRSYSEVWGNVIIVDCDEEVNYSSNLYDAVTKESGDVRSYYSGTFFVSNIVSHSTNFHTTEFVACRNILLSTGFKADGLGKKIRMYLHSNLIQGNSNEGLQKSGLLAEDTNVDHTTLQKIKLNSTFCEVFPNPVCDVLWVSLGDYVENTIVKYLIYDIAGKVIKENTLDDDLTAIDASDLSKGIYILSVKLGANVLYKKFIKE